VCIPNHFLKIFLPTAWDFRRFISISHSHQPVFTTLGEMIHVDKRINPQHFGTDSTDIRIRINPAIWIRIPDHIVSLAEFAVSDCSYIIIPFAAVVYSARNIVGRMVAKKM